MNTKEIIKILFGFSIIGSFVGYVFTNSVVFNLCTQNAISCRSTFNQIGDPLFYGAVALSVVFLVLLFVPQAFKVWKRFAIWFIPLGVLFSISYISAEQNTGLFLGRPSTEVYQAVSVLYVITSILLIIVQAFMKPPLAKTVSRYIIVATIAAFAWIAFIWSSYFF